jgi:hypothetical protein
VHPPKNIPIDCELDKNHNSLAFFLSSLFESGKEIVGVITTNL